MSTTFTGCTACCGVVCCASALTPSTICCTLSSADCPCFDGVQFNMPFTTFPVPEWTGSVIVPKDSCSIGTGSGIQFSATLVCIAGAVTCATSFSITAFYKDNGGNNPFTCHRASGGIPTPIFCTCTPFFMQYTITFVRSGDTLPDCCTGSALGTASISLILTPGPC